MLELGCKLEWIGSTPKAEKKLATTAKICKCADGKRLPRSQMRTCPCEDDTSHSYLHVKGCAAF
eukprot:6020263-Pyramimonas_sp.AAC.2